jgi:hypothetical protein
MTIRALIASLGLALCLVAAGCGSSKQKAVSTATVPTATGVSHDAPDLEALLPGKFGGKPLQKGSTTGAVVFGGGDAFSSQLSKFLSSKGKRPADLRFANAQSQALGLETGVFQVEGVPGTALATAIVAASRPNAPGLTAGASTLSGRSVTRIVYPGGSILYLYPHGDDVFYVGTQDQTQAGKVLSLLP